MWRTFVPVLALAGLVGLAPVSAPPAQSRFAELIASASEPGGYFDTDNLISNESSYLQVLPELAASRVAGGAYIGVGPDQNFTYIAEVRPSIAFIVDIRRDNLLLQLLFKALFQLSRSRAEYLSMLFGRPLPPDGAAWREAPIERIAAYLERNPASGIEPLRARVDAAIAAFGVPLSAEDRRTIDRFHRTFIDAGLSLRFQTAGQAPRSYYPSYRDLLLDRDPSGRQSNAFASEDAFQYVRSLESRDLVIPIVGDLGGRSALTSVGRLLEARHDRLTAFYTSNVEFYLFRDGRFPQFVRNLGAIPRTDRAIVIRSVFSFYAGRRTRPGDDSVSSTQRVDDLLSAAASGRIQRYSDLIGR